MAFKKGDIGNPKGHSGDKRRKEKQLRELLLKFVPDAVDVVGNALKDPDIALTAAKEVFDRVFGKSPQALELQGPDGEKIIINLTLRQKDA